MKLLALAALAFTVSACCACRRSGNTVPLTGTEWRLSQLGDETVTSDNFRMTLEDDGRVSGIGDCNRFNGTFTRGAGGRPTSGGLTVGDNLVSTRMMCPNQAREAAFLTMLRQVDSFNIDGERLLLLHGGNVLAIFDRIVSAAPVAVGQ